MSILKKVFKYGNLIGLATSLAKKGIGAALKPLAPKTPKLQGLASAEQVQNPAAQNNTARLGEPKTVLYGENPKYYPSLRAQAWLEFINNEPELHLWLHVSVGICGMTVLDVGSVPFTSLGGSVYRLLRPGERNDLFHPNVYTNTEVNGIELAAGALVSLTTTREFAFGGGGHPSRIDGGNNAFNGVRVGGTAVVTGTAGDDGTYTITAYDTGGSEPNWIEVTHAFAGTTETASVRFGSYNLKKNAAVMSESVRLAFVAGFSEIRATPDDDHPNNLSKFLIGDIVAAIDDGAGANRNVSFTVLGVSGDGTKLIVDPPPANLAGVISTVVLLRRFHGPAPVCPPGDQVSDVAFDFELPNGIGNIDTKNGTIADITLRIEAQWQRIDDVGTPLGPWVSFDEIVITASSRKAYRQSFKFPLPVPARVHVRPARASIDATGDDILDAINWVGARGYVINKAGEDAAVDDDSTTLVINLRRGQGGGPNDDLKINGTFPRWLRTWDAGTRTWLPETPTRLVAWAALDKLNGPYTMRGRQVPDEDVDIASFAALVATAAEFNGQFGVQSNLWDNLNLILSMARAEAVFRWRDNRLAAERDEFRPPMQMFCDLNSRASGYYVPLRTEKDPTGMLASYLDPGLAAERPVRAGDTSNKPLKLDLRNGCANRQQAWELVSFKWLVELFRRRPVTINGELEPLTLGRGDRVLVQSAEYDWGQAAHVVFQVGRALLVWPPLDWSGSGHYVILRSPRGRPGAAIPCTRDDADYRLVLDADPDVEFTGDANREERTLMIFGKAGDEPVIAIVNDVGWQIGKEGGQTATLPCTVDDMRVYVHPGPAPVDTFAPVINRPSLAIAGLDATDNGDGSVTASCDVTPAALLYECDWHYLTDISWTPVQRGLGTAATFTVPAAGAIEVRIRALGNGGAIGAYSVVPLTVVF